MRYHLQHLLPLSPQPVWVPALATAGFSRGQGPQGSDLLSWCTVGKNTSTFLAKPTPAAAALGHGLRTGSRSLSELCHCKMLSPGATGGSAGNDTDLKGHDVSLACCLACPEAAKDTLTHVTGSYLLWKKKLGFFLAKSLNLLLLRPTYFTVSLVLSPFRPSAAWLFAVLVQLRERKRVTEEGLFGSNSPFPEQRAWKQFCSCCTMCCGGDITAVLGKQALSRSAWQLGSNTHH